MQLTDWMRAHGKTKCDILKAAHHGSRIRHCGIFPQQLTPKYAWISSGIGNRYGHPAKGDGRGLREKDASLWDIAGVRGSHLKNKREKSCDRNIFAKK